MEPLEEILCAIQRKLSSASPWLPIFSGSPLQLNVTLEENFVKGFWKAFEFQLHCCVSGTDVSKHCKVSVLTESIRFPNYERWKMIGFQTKFRHSGFWPTMRSDEQGQSQKWQLPVFFMMSSPHCHLAFIIILFCFFCFKFDCIVVLSNKSPIVSTQLVHYKDMIAAITCTAVTTRTSPSPSGSP